MACQRRAGWLAHCHAAGRAAASNDRDLLPECSMKSLWKFSPWLSRLIILAVASLFTMISLKFIFHPQQSAADSGIVIQPGLGFTNTRAGFGGFPLGFAVILIFCLFSSRRLLAALSAIVTVAAVILAVRLYGA